MVVSYTEIQRFLRYPEVRKDSIFVLLIYRRKHQNKSRNVRGGRRGKTDVVDAPFKIIFENREGTGVSLAHQHPVDGLLHPLVEP